MIILTIRTDKPESEIGLYDDHTQLNYIKWEAHRQLAETLHNVTQEMVTAQNMTLANIDGIVIFQGPGSFTGLRIGISMANALAYGLKVPIIGRQNESWIEDGVAELIARNNALPVIPFYGSDANITTPKK